MSQRSPVKLLENISGTLNEVEAVLIERVSNREMIATDASWQAFLQPILEKRAGISRRRYSSWRMFAENAYRAIIWQGGSLDDLPEHPHWNWQDKNRGMGYHSFGVEYQGEMQGLMLIRTDKKSRLSGTLAEPLVYVDYLASAPWNLPLLTQTPRFRGVGLALMTASVQLSLDSDRSGRLGLHALPGAEDFYRSPRKCGMTDLGTDGLYSDLRYFEMSPSQALSLLARVKQ